MSAAERGAVAAWTTPAELGLFDRMHRADQRHGLDVVRHLQASGVRERNVLVAGLLHDCGKGDAGVAPRVAWSLGEAWGPWVVTAARTVPGWRPVLRRLREHAELSARLVEAAGSSARTVELVRNQAQPQDDTARLLYLADEAS